MKPPNGAAGSILQYKCANLKTLLVDERSLIGSNTLGWMEFMCRHGGAAHTGSSESWGGLPVVVFLGDDVQLPPVLDTPVYKPVGTTSAAMHGALVWKEFQTVVDLQTIIRQSTEEQVFREVLMALRENKMTKEHAAWLLNFQWHKLLSTKGKDLMQRMESSGLFVFPSHEEEAQHNNKKHLEANKSNPVAKLKAKGQGTHGNTGDFEKAGGLLSTVYICKTAKVMLTANLNVKYGIFNGAQDEVVDIVYTNDHKPSDSFPDVVMVNFPCYTGPPFIQENAKLEPLVPISRKIECRCNNCKRTQIPLRLGWATTIHRCQDMTIGEGQASRYTIINPGTRSFES